LRYEFDGSQPVAMTGGSVEHSVIKTNLVRELEDWLRGGACRAFRGDVKILVTDRVRYPDAVVTCSPVPRGTDVIPNLVVVFEVLSPSTAVTDRIARNRKYRATPSIGHYVVIEQAEMAATVFTRQGDGWGRAGGFRGNHPGDAGD
jgi:Uma2 family endonuclease